MFSSNIENNHEYVAEVKVVSLLGLIFMALLLAFGAGIQSYSNGTIEAFLVAFIFMAIGCGGIALVFPGKKEELRAFLLAYTICVFVGGVAQLYSLSFFDQLQSTPDANTFFQLIKPNPPFMTMERMPHINAPLAVLAWQYVYQVAWWLGFDFGLYTGVMLNAFVIGLTASITVRTARELFGDNSVRLRRVGTLFAFCGLFILFGSVLIRDCFTTFFNMLALWGMIRWLCSPTLLNSFKAIIVTGVAVYAVAFLRYDSIVLFGFFWLLAVLFWLMKKQFNIARIFAVYFVSISLLIGSPYVINYVQRSKKSQEHIQKAYAGQPSISYGKSLGMQLVIRQPMPIRLVMGSGFLMISQIPIWGYFRPGLGEYHLIKAYHGVFQVIVMPLFLAGFLLVIKLFFKDREQAIPLAFLAAYTLMALFAVVATSLEQRHLAQFIPAVLILASVPDLRVDEDRAIVRATSINWCVVVLFVHVLWMMKKWQIL